MSVFCHPEIMHGPGLRTVGRWDISPRADAHNAYSRHRLVLLKDIQTQPHHVDCGVLHHFRTNARTLRVVEATTEY
jgi:hypothetical protein